MTDLEGGRNNYNWFDAFYYPDIEDLSLSNDKRLESLLEKKEKFEWVETKQLVRLMNHHLEDGNYKWAALWNNYLLETREEFKGKASPDDHSKFGFAPMTNEEELRDREPIEFNEDRIEIGIDIPEVRRLQRIREDRLRQVIFQQIQRERLDLGSL